MQGSVCAETETWTHKHKFLTLLLRRMEWRDPRWGLQRDFFGILMLLILSSKKLNFLTVALPFYCQVF